MEEEQPAVDVRDSRGVQIGKGGTQYNVFLNADDGPRGPMFTVPRLSGREISRPHLVDELATLITAHDRGTVTMSTTLRGAGGFGKTTLACMVAADPRVVAQFPDGILWVPLAEDVAGAELADRVDDIIALLTGKKPALTNPELAGAELGQALGDKRILLVIDDVWSESQLQPFSYGGPGTVRLVTTRQRSIARGGQSLDVDAMAPEEARLLLTRDLRAVPEVLVDRLLSATGRWPVLLGLVNGMAVQDAQAGQPAEDSLTEILEALFSDGPTVLDPANAEARQQAVETTLGASLARLTPDQRERYLELAVFGEDVQIPRGVVERLWAHTAGWKAFETKKFCQQLMDLSLLASYRLDAPGPRLLLHDVIRRYLRGQAGLRLAELDRAVVEAHRPLVPVNDAGASVWSRLPPSQTYLWTWLASHLWAAGLLDELIACLHSGNYLASKLELDGPAALATDLDLLDDDLMPTLRSVVIAEAHLLAPIEPAGALRATFASRLRGFLNGDQVAADITQTLTPPALRPVGVLPDVPIDAKLDRIGHTDPVRTLAVHPSGEWLASAGDDGQIIIWDVEARSPKRILVANTSGIGKLVVASDGSRLAAVGSDGAVRIWNPVTGELQQTLVGHRSGVFDVSFSPDWSWLASCGREGSVRVWDLATGTCRHVLGQHVGGATVVEVSPDGSWMASGGRDGVVRIWDPHTGQEILGVHAHDNEVSALAAAPDGSWLASGGAGQNSVVILDIAERDVRQTFSTRNRVYRLAVSADGSLLSAGGHGDVHIWNLADGAEHQLDRVLGSVHALAFAPAGDALAFAGAGALRLWRSEEWNGSQDWPWSTGEQLSLGHFGVIHDLAFSPDGAWFATCGDDGTVRIWPAADPVIPGKAKERILPGYTSRLHALAAAPDGHWIAVGGDTGVAEAWVVSTGARQNQANLANHSTIGQLAARSEGWVVAGSGSGKVQAWNPAQGMIRNLIGSHDQRISSLAVSPNGDLVFSADESGRIIARDWSNTPRWSGKVHRTTVTAMALLNHGEWLATVGSTGEIIVCDPADGSTLYRLEQRQRITHMVAAPESQWLATNSLTGHVHVWDVDTGTQGQVDRHHDPVHGLAIAPNQWMLATGGDDAEVILWDALGATMLQQLSGHTSPVRAVAFHSDGTLLASVSWDGTIRIWDVQTGAAVTSLRVNGWLGSVLWVGDTVVAAGRHGPYILRLDRAEAEQNVSGRCRRGARRSVG